MIYIELIKCWFKRNKTLCCIIWGIWSGLANEILGNNQTSQGESYIERIFADISGYFNNWENSREKLKKYSYSLKNKVWKFLASLKNSTLSMHLNLDNFSKIFGCVIKFPFSEFFIEIIFSIFPDSANIYQNFNYLARNL